MKYPLKGKVTVTGKFGEKAVPGTGLKDKKGVARHIGVDLRAAVGTPFYAPGKGKVRVVDMVGNKILEVEIGGKYHRFLHLSSFAVGVGKSFKEGQLLGKTGNSGGVKAHLHWDVRKKGTTWNASFYNYYNPQSLVGATVQPVYTRVKAGEGLSAIAKRAGYKDWLFPTAWIRLSRLNGYGLNWKKFNNALKPGQKIRVR